MPVSPPIHAVGKRRIDFPHDLLGLVDAFIDEQGFRRRDEIPDGQIRPRSERIIRLQRRGIVLESIDIRSLEQRFERSLMIDFATCQPIKRRGERRRFNPIGVLPEDLLGERRRSKPAARLRIQIRAEDQVARFVGCRNRRRRVALRPQQVGQPGPIRVGRLIFGPLAAACSIRRSRRSVTSRNAVNCGRPTSLLATSSRISSI